MSNFYDCASQWRDPAGSTCLTRNWIFFCRTFPAAWNCRNCGLSGSPSFEC